MSERLNNLIALTSKTHCLADVGADHGKYGLMAIKQKLCAQLVVCDIAEAPLNNAQTLLFEANITAKTNISFHLSDGLRTVPPAKHISAACIAGLSGKTIISIINNDFTRFRQMEYLLLQPMQTAPLLREWLALNGFSFVDEKIVQEGTKYYPIVMVRYTGEIRKLTEIAQNIGPINLTNMDKVTKEYCRKVYLQKQKSLAGIMNGNQINNAKLAHVAKIIKDLEGYV